jgi:glycosyltransferase involved in cell wall biosynthesis
MRVAMVVDSDAFGGAEVYTGHLLRKLPGQVRRSLIVSEQVAARMLPAAGRCEAVRVVPLSRHAPEAPAIADAVQRLAPDVVQVNLVDPASNAAALAAALDRRPTVATLHLQGDTGTQAARLRSLYHRLAAAIAPSRAIHQQLVDLGVPPGRAVRIRNGVDVPVAPAPQRVRAVPRIGSVGRLTEQKGFDVLLAAVAEMRCRSLPDFQVVIVGAGRERESLERRARDLPVRFLGECSDVPAVLRRLDVFCLGSRREAVSLALMEAMAHGLPCVATDVGDTREAVAADALLVPPEQPHPLADALCLLLADPGMRRALGDRARERARRKFTAERMAADTAVILLAAARESRQQGLSLSEHVLDRHVTGARKADGAPQVRARRTRDTGTHGTLAGPSMRPPDGITGQEHGDAAPSYRGGEVRGTRVVGDQKGGMPEQQRILPESRPPGQVNRFGSHADLNPLCQRPLATEPPDDDA